MLDPIWSGRPLNTSMTPPERSRSGGPGVSPSNYPGYPAIEGRHRHHWVFEIMTGACSRLQIG